MKICPKILKAGYINAKILLKNHGKNFIIVIITDEISLGKFEVLLRF